MSALAISQDNSQIITGSADTRVRIYTHTKNGYILNQTIIGGNSRITSAVFYDDNSGALVSSTDGKVRHYVSCFSVLYGCSDCLSAIFCSSCS
jgi:WD40 repeat protein